MEPEALGEGFVMLMFERHRRSKRTQTPPVASTCAWHDLFVSTSRSRTPRLRFGLHLNR
jgi:hypothetical protein